MNPIKFSKIAFKNFMGYGNILTSIDLTQTGTTLILGKNGVGKTTIMNAIVYALFNRPISKINVDDLINIINKKDMLVSLEFYIGKTKYVITRSRKGPKIDGKETWVKLTANGKDETSSDIEKKIESIIGMPYEMFIRVIVISALHQPFLELDSSKQTSFIENLFNLLILSERAKTLNSHMKNTNDSIEVQQNKIEHVEKAMQRHAEQVASAESRVLSWDKAKMYAIEEISRELANIPKINFDKEKELLEKLKVLAADIEKLQYQEDLVKSAEQRVVTWDKNQKQTIASTESSLALLANIDFEKETELHAKLQELKTAINEILSRQETLAGLIKDYTKKEDEYTHELESLHSNKCPYCEQVYAASKDKITKAEANLKEAQTKVDGFAETLAKLQEELPSFTTERLDIESSLKVKELKKLQESQRQHEILVTKLEDLKKVENPHVEALGSARTALQEMTHGGKSLSKLKAERSEVERKTTVQNLDKLQEIKSKNQSFSEKLTLNEASVNPHYDALEELQKMDIAAPDYTEINKLQKRKTHEAFLYKLLTKRDSFARKDFINRYLPYLNKRLKEYLEFLELPFKVEFTSELSAKITRFGSDIVFAQLSNGQQARVNLGLALAFRDVQASLHPPVNICLLDEVFDLGLDDEGIDLATKILQKKAREEKLNMFLISHRGLSKTSFDRSYTVSIEKEFSIIDAG